MTDKEVMLIVLNELVGIQKNCSSLLNRIENQRGTLETALTQPNKEWVGLTEEEINSYKGKIGLYFLRQIEEKLKEKNGY